MLGIGRASQYAGWWSSGSPKVTFTSSSNLAYTNSQTPSYSLLTGVGGSPAGSWDIVTSGNYNLTGYTSLSEFNNARSTIVGTIYLDWPTSGIGSSDFVSYSFFNQLQDNGSVLYYNPQIQLINSNTQLQIGQAVPGAGQNLVLTGSYADYVGRWLTIVWSSSETSSSYTNWAGTGSGSYSCRTAVFDTEFGVLLGKKDYLYTFTTPTIANWPSTTPADNPGTYGYFAGGFGSGSSPTYYNTRLSNFWTSFGTMFDPLTTTNTSWRTTRPSATIGTAVAWQNLQLTDYQTDTSLYYVTAQGMDLYTQATDKAAKSSGWTSTEWTNDYSSTITTKDSA